MRDRSAYGKGWFTESLFGLHYDLHARADDTDLGRGIDHERLLSHLARVRPDFVQWDCKGHPGYASYPTEVGTASPGIVCDALRVVREVTYELGIPLTVHYSGVWDDAAMEQHPEWRRVGPDGVPVTGKACLTSDYTSKLVIPQMLEVIDRYDVDGFWVDGENWAVAPCYCDRCRRRFGELTGGEVPSAADEGSWPQWLAFHRDAFEAHVRAYTDAVHARKPSCQVCSNWMYSVRQPGPVRVSVDYLSGDTGPSWATERLLPEARFLDGRGLPWGLMVWSFLTGEDDWGGWTEKTAEHMCREAAEVLAVGGRVWIYGRQHRDGKLTGWMQDLYAVVAQFCRERRSVCTDSESVPQAAVLHGGTAFYARNPESYGLDSASDAPEGALHALADARRHADLLDEEGLLSHLDAYPLVVVPEQDPLAPEVVDALSGYVVSGGRLIISGAAVSRNPQLATLVGVEPVGARLDDTYRALPVGHEAVTVAGPWQPVRVTDAETDEFLPLLSGEDPEHDRAGTAAVTVSRSGEGLAAAVHGPVFSAYQRTRYPRLRSMLSDLFDYLWAEPMVEVETPRRPAAPVGISVRRQPGLGHLVVHLLNRGAEPPLSPRNHMIESVPEIGPLLIRVRLRERPSSVAMVPSTDYASRWHDGLLEVEVARLEIHAALVVQGA